ncbi:synaptobrevin-type transport protein [Trypanosoma grayi]|uniref:synaptobrevin-type transport protein n=1 Tax=Trypanosoma grayi TaxID=71804 RepID=UPI0004F4A931|nr:synaptobrevin-type transport protein [Trypanosoma grayi]KEG10182.1 synaptobrevin-type transport protein [Trypanosoma grayi]
MATNGCFIAVLIARTHDHVPLCSYTDDNYANSNQIRQQEQRILERMESPAATSERKDAKGSYYQSFDHRDCIYFAFQDAATDLTIITVINKLLLRNSGDIATTNRLACGLLDLVFAEFTQSYSVTEVAANNVRPFQFIKFDTTLQRLIQRMQQERQGENALMGVPGTPQRRQVNPHYDALRQELTDVHFVMRKNLEDLMTRGEKLETMNHFSAQLVDQSSRFYKKTVHMNRMRLLRLYGPPAVVGIILVVFFYFYFF